MSSQADLDRAVEQIRFARAYTSGLLADIDPGQWFVIPAGAATHIAWQVGHLASAQFFLALVRQRGEQPADEQHFPPALRQLFGRGSVPSADPADYPSAAEIRTVFDLIHEQVLVELAVTDPSALDDICAKPHRIARTKLDSLFWCANHELIHAGQIALLRRMLGMSPQW